MSRQFASKLLSGCADIATVLLCVALGLAVFRTPQPPSSGAMRTTLLSPGSRLPPIPGLNDGNGGVKLLAFLDSKCKVCRESAEDYRELSRLVKGGRMYPVYENADADAKGVFGLAGMYVNSFSVYGIHGTPTLVLLNETGVIRDVWIGRLTPVAKRLVVDKIGSF